MIFGDHVGLKFPDICLAGDEKPRKNPHQEKLSRPGIEPGVRCVIGAHATTCSTAMDRYVVQNQNIVSGSLPFQNVKMITEFFVGKSEEKSLLGRPRCRWEDNIKMDLRETCCDAGDWVDRAQDRH